MRVPVVAKVQDSNIVESRFEIRLSYYVPFRTNILGKDMNIPFLPPCCGSNSITTYHLSY